MRWINLPRDDAELAALRKQAADKMRELGPIRDRILSEFDEAYRTERAAYDEQLRRERNARWAAEERSRARFHGTLEHLRLDMAGRINARNGDAS